MIQFEQYRKNGEYFVRLVLNGDVQPMDCGPDGLCTYAAMQAKLTALVPSDKDCAASPAPTLPSKSHNDMQMILIAVGTGIGGFLLGAVIVALFMRRKRSAREGYQPVNGSYN